MKKKWMIGTIIGIVLLGIIGFGLGTAVARQQEAASQASTKVSQSHKHHPKKVQLQQIKGKAQKEKASSSDNNNDNTASNLTPKQMAALVAYHGSTLNNNGWNAWDDLTNNNVRDVYILNQSDAPVQVSQPGTGVIYSFNDQGNQLNFYTISQDGKQVYVYCYDTNNGTDDPINPIDTTTVKDMVNQAQADGQMDTIKGIANNLQLDDDR